MGFMGTTINSVAKFTYHFLLNQNIKTIYLLNLSVILTFIYDPCRGRNSFLCIVLQICDSSGIKTNLKIFHREMMPDGIKYL